MLLETGLGRLKGRALSACSDEADRYRDLCWSVEYARGRCTSLYFHLQLDKRVSSNDASWVIGEDDVCLVLVGHGPAQNHENKCLKENEMSAMPDSRSLSIASLMSRNCNVRLLDTRRSRPSHRRTKFFRPCTTAMGFAIRPCDQAQLRAWVLTRERDPDPATICVASGPALPPVSVSPV